MVEPSHKRSDFIRILQNLSFFIPLAIIFVSASVAEAGKLSIVIDDIGYRQKEDNAIYALPKEVSVAIIPEAPYATRRAKQAFQQKRNVLIHLPMEPKKAVSLEKGALKVGDSEAKIMKLIANARGQVPYAIGLNNHMGSGATSDLNTMQNLMKVLKQNDLFFLDSKTIGSSVAAKTAREMGIGTLERDIFLDDSDELQAVQKQFERAVLQARKNGIAILIGHPRKNSVKVLQDGLSRLPKDIELVSIGALWRKEKITPEKPFIMLFEYEPAITTVSPFESVPLLRGIPKE